VFLGAGDQRKNFGLLQQVWEKLRPKGSLPTLYAVGATPVPGGRPGILHVPGCTDVELANLIRTARALLFPSLAEGFGFPLLEAYALRAPVICSDLPVFREVSRGHAEFLPVDVDSWAASIAEYSRPDSARRQSQLARLEGCPIPTWAEHFDGLAGLLRQHRLTEPASAPA
jgi:glycosyltransferase involved in cell wall biosynthesis